MNIFLVLCLCVTTALASGGHDMGGHGFGGGHGFSFGSIKAPAFVLPIPEIGLSFDKIPLFIPFPTIFLRKKPAVVSKPVFMPLSHDFGGSHGGYSGGGGYGGGGGQY